MKLNDSHCEKKLAHLLFDFGVVCTTDDRDDCEQQFRPSPAVYNSWQHRRSAWLTTAVVWRQVEQEAVVNIWNLNIQKLEYLFRRASGDNLNAAWGVN